MDTVAFFNLILPASGLRCLAVPYTGGKGFKHFFNQTNEWLAKAAHHADTARHLNTYFAVASYKDGSSRTQGNVAYVRSFWVDLDVGPPEAGKPPKYATQREAAKDVVAFAAKLGLPRPFLVSSGRGVHVYWPMDADMVPSVWRSTAQRLKAALEQEGVLQDKSRTADHASVLRPPGTHHRKAEPKLVRVVLEGEIGRLADFQTILAPYGGEDADDFLPEGGPVAGLENTNSDLTSGVETRKANADLIAKECGVLRMVRDTGGNVDQPTWYRMLGVIGACENGEQLVHEWSKGHPDYSPAETDRAMKRCMAYKPSTCERLGETHSAICAACPHNGKINSPWALGLRQIDTVTVETTVKTAFGFQTKSVEVEMPPGFRTVEVMGRRVLQSSVALEQSKEEKEAGEKLAFEWETFCDTAVIPITRLWVEGVAYVECEMDLRKNEKRRFLLEGGLIGKGKDTLAAELGRQEVVTKYGKGHIMDSYMKAWMQRLKDDAEQVVAHRHFGWEGRSFVFGDSVLHPDGTDARAVLVGAAKSKRAAVSIKGSLEEWVRIVDVAYNAEGQEAFQFLVVAGFAAPLLSMMQQVSGVTVYAHSEGSGVGKTTAQKVALSAWGDWYELMLADQKTTQNALWGLMGAYNTLPIVYDELTNMPNNLASELVFSASSGRSKQRMTAGGELRDNNSNWCTILLASGNNLLSEKLSLHRGNAEAEISRLFEFTLRASPHLSPNEANELFPLLRENYGHAGQVYARHLVDNYDTVVEMLRATQARINTHLNISQVERYWSALIASCLVAASLCRQLGLLKFEIAGLKKWMFDRLAENRFQRDEAVSQPLELLGGMLADLWQGVLVTQGEGDLRSGKVANVLQKPHGALVGRAIVPASKNEQAVLLLNVQAVKDWANKKGVSAREMFGAAVKAGWADAQEIRYSLGKGTVEYSQTSSYLKCWKLNPERMGSAAGSLVAQKFGVVDGGSAAAGTGP